MKLLLQGRSSMVFYVEMIKHASVTLRAWILWDGHRRISVSFGHFVLNGLVLSYIAATNDYFNNLINLWIIFLH